MIRDPEGTERQMIGDLLGPSAGNVLEVGCGNGRLTTDLSALSCRILGLDLDPVSINQARSLCHEGTRFILGSGETMPLADDCFDCVVFSFSLHHQEPVRALGEALRVLKPDGRILVLEPVEHSLVTRLFALLHDESGEYERAEVAIVTSGLKELRSGSFRSTWLFEDFNEMTDYLFDYFGLAPDLESKDRMAELLGDRRKQKPLGIDETTRYWLLQPGPSLDLPQVP